MPPMEEEPSIPHPDEPHANPNQESGDEPIDVPSCGPVYRFGDDDVLLALRQENACNPALKSCARAIIEEIERSEVLSN